MGGGGLLFFENGLEVTQHLYNYLKKKKKKEETQKFFPLSTAAQIITLEVSGKESA